MADETIKKRHWSRFIVQFVLAVITAGLIVLIILPALMMPKH